MNAWQWIAFGLVCLVSAELILHRITARRLVILESKVEALKRSERTSQWHMGVIKQLRRGDSVNGIPAAWCEVPGITVDHQNILVPLCGELPAKDEAVGRRYVLVGFLGGDPHNVVGIVGPLVPTEKFTVLNPRTGYIGVPQGVPCDPEGKPIGSEVRNP